MPEVRIGGCDVGTLAAGSVINLTEEEAAQYVKDGLASYTDPLLANTPKEAPAPAEPAPVEESQPEESSNDAASQD